ncbi:MAG: tetratricopeptide repeat protein [Aphanothece sp. CMT-3BRIN-NPC111]|jgi:tetratricopeptide (TPR) repeat protein|nr:tetratricopeptide repeat protein [Aphanothece sp. CMT-3BRIN-NPC111]
MTYQIPHYISRKQAQDFLAKFAQALEEPELQPVLFHVYGFGGVGKSTLTRKLKEEHKQQADFAKVSFGLTPDIETPLKLMVKLYDQLPQPPSLLKRDVGDLFPKDPFTSLYDKYQQTVHELKTKPVQGKSVDADQQNTVKDWFELGSLTLISLAANSVNPAAALGVAFDGLAKAGGMLSKAPEAIASTKERMQQLLQQHPATKKDKELQVLMLEPIPKLTQAFAEGLSFLAQKQKRPVVLILDTYEKVPSDIDTWLWQYLLEDTALKSYPVRLVVAGRRPLLEKEGWRKLQQDRDLIYEQRLAEFDKKQTKEYLQQIGITEAQDIQKIYKATKGLPYYLNWIRESKDKGEPIDFSRGNQAIVELLLQGLNAKQKQIVQLAACCRWFDRSLIQYLMKRQGIDFETVADPMLDCFEWLTQRDFVELVQSRYRLDDVARDVFRLSVCQEDKNQFRHTHELLAKYFEEQANQEVSSDSPAPAKYDNPDWCQYTAEFLYHALFARRDDGQRQFLSHLFASRYLNQIDVVTTFLVAVAAEAEVENYHLLPNETEKFLERIKLVFPLGWVVLKADPAKYEINYEYWTGQSKEEIEVALRPYFSQVDFLEDGLGKYAGLLYKSLRCRTLDPRVDLLLRAKEQAERIATATYPEFSTSLLFEVANWLYQLGRYEEVLASYDKALAIKDDDPVAWNNRGSALANLGRDEEALASYDKALAIKDDDPKAWYNRGTALANLGRDEEALASYDKALAIKDDNPKAWNNRGNVLTNLSRDEEALASYDKALKIKPDDPHAWSMRGLVLSRLGRYGEALANHGEALKLQPKFPLWWANRGIVLARAGCYEEALASCDKALELQPQDESGYYGKACCYALQDDSYMAIENLQQAINLNPHRCQMEAKINSDFDSLRVDKRFQALMQEKTN